MHLRAAASLGKCPRALTARRMREFTLSIVILSRRIDHGFELLLYDSDGVDDVGVHHGPMAVGTGAAGVSWEGGFGPVTRRWPRASARAWRSRLLSVSSS